MSSSFTDLNNRARRVVESMRASQPEFRVREIRHASGGAILDCGVKAVGGIQAGLRLAAACLSDLASVSLIPASTELPAAHAIQVATDHPLMACMASQYAGWEVKGDDFFAMASGPMRLLARKEELIRELEFEDHSDCAVGVLETSQVPSEDVLGSMAEACGLPPSVVTLCVARTASLAGTIQVVARSLETALHKLHELQFPWECILSGVGRAPLPPVAETDLRAIGWTNDAILYGGEVTLWVKCEDSLIEEFGPRVPSNASSDFGDPFAAIFEKYGHDFYRIDRQLFSPALVHFCNLATGRTHVFGEMRPDVLTRSFSG